MSYTFTIAPVTPETFSQAGGVYEDAWRDSHRGICTPEFLYSRDCAAYLQKERDAGKALFLLWEWSAFGRAGLTICMYCPGVRAGAMARRCCASPWPMGDGGSPSSPPTPEQLDSMRSMDFLRAAESSSGKICGN